MSLRYGLLGLLAAQPMSGYELTKKFDRSLAHAWSAKHSQIYPELARLREEGLIEQTESGPRGRKTYSITPAGLDAVRSWMSETKPVYSARSEASLRMFFLWLLDRDQATRFLERDLEYHQALLAEFEHRARTWIEGGPVDAAQRVALEWGIRYERARVEWGQWALGQVDSLAPEAKAGKRPAGRRAKAAPRS